MFRYSIQIDDGAIDLDRIAKSGQMFRWLTSQASWKIHDGDHWYEVASEDHQMFHVESNQPQVAFEKLFRLDTRHEDLLETILSRGEELKPFIENRHGLRLMRPYCRTETLFSFLCSANNHVSRITKMVWSLASHGKSGFPTIEELTKISEARLRELGFGYRGGTIPKVAQLLHSNGGEQYLDELARVGYADARNELISLPGVGKKLADCICLFAFDYKQSVPIDTHIWQVMTRLYFPHWQNTNLTDTKYETVVSFFQDRFGDVAGTAHQFLFVDNMERYRKGELRKSVAS